MLPNIEYLKEKFTQTYSWLADYYYGPQQNIDNLSKLTPEDKILVLRKLLKSQCIYSQETQGKIQMQYSKIIQSLNYKNFSFTTQVPPQHPVPQKLPQKKLICVLGEYNLKKDKIKCPLLVQILFDESFPQTLPKFYVQTPKFPEQKQSPIKLLRTARPNRLVVEIVNKRTDQKEVQYKFKARTDGIQVILPQRKRDQKIDVKALLDECVELMKNEFPFVKMKQPVMLADIDANLDEKTKLLYEKGKRIKQILILPNQKPQKPLHSVLSVNRIDSSQLHQDSSQSHLPSFIQNTQLLDIVSKSMQSQIQYNTQQSQKMKTFLNQAQIIERELQKSQTFSSFYPTISGNLLQKQLFEVLVDYQASNDCLIQVERFIKSHDKLEHDLLNPLNLKKAMTTWQTISQNIFFQRYKINQLINQIKSNQ